MPNIDITLKKNLSLYKIFPVKTSQDMSTWNVFCFLFDPAAPTVALVTVGVTVDAAGKSIIISTPPADLAGLFAAHTRLGIALLVNPGGTLVDELASGTVSLAAGVPPCSV